MNALHIVPPGEGGVADFAFVLSHAMKNNLSIECESVSNRFDILKRLHQKSDVLIVHYSNYGFAKRGCPLWLIRELAEYQTKFPATRIISIFHEVYATGKLWNSSFWLSPVQRWLAGELVHISTAIITSIHRYKARILNLAPHSGQRISVMPVYSTVGEPKDIPAMEQRAPRMIVFGGAGRRGLVYQNSFQTLIEACTKLGLEEIIDIGTPVPIPSPGSRISIRNLGPMHPTEVSRWMLDARAGFIDYPHPYLAKSTIFAAYCAHGLLPVSAGNAEGLPEDGLDDGENFLSAEEIEAAASSTSTISSNAIAWYRPHSLSRHIEMLSTILKLKFDGAEKLA